MSSDALLLKVDPVRKARALGLTVSLRHLDMVTGMVQANVLSSNGTDTYAVRLNLVKRTCHCACKDFDHQRAPCKHLAATVMLLQRLAVGVAVTQPALPSHLQAVG